MKAREIVVLVLLIAGGIILTQERTGKVWPAWRFDDVFIFDGRAWSFQETQTLEAPLPAVLRLVNAHGGVTVEGADTVSITVILKKTVRRHSEAEAKAVADALHTVITRDGSRAVIGTNRTDLSERGLDTDLRLIVPAGTAIEVENSYGTVSLNNLGSRASVDGRHCEITAVDVAGPLDVRNSYELVTLRRVGSTKVTGQHSDVEAAGVNGDLTVETSYAEVSANDIKGALRVTGKSVGLTGKDVAGAEIYVSTSYEPVELAGFSGKTTIIAAHGDVTLAPLPLTGPIEVRGEYAGIRLRLPSGGPYALEARTRSGSIDWRLPEKVTIQDKDGFREVKAFPEMTGRPAILLVTSYDDITIEGGTE